MKTIALNHMKLSELMAANSLRPVDISARLNVSPQMMNYILHHGGRQYATPLSRILKCNPEDLLVISRRKIERTTKAQKGEQA